MDQAKQEAKPSVVFHRKTVVVVAVVDVVDERKGVGIAEEVG